jgi:hypothetical protein
MRYTRVLPILAGVLLYAVACGSSSSNKNPDAKGSGTGTDAGTGTGTPDAASGSDVGLTCTVAGSAVTGCTGLTGKPNVTCVYGQTMAGFCTTACDKAASVTANGSGTDFLATDYTAAQTAGDATCTTLYGSLAGSATVHCELPLNINPAPKTTNPPLTPNGKYTTDFYCAIECTGTGQGNCPNGMACMNGICDHP